MTIGRTISIKIFNYDSSPDEFISTIQKTNKENKINLIEKPLDYTWGYQDEDNSFRINLKQSKQKIEFALIYENKDQVLKYLEMIKTFLKHSKFNFKAIALAFGEVYFDFPTVNYKFKVPNFKNDNELKYKVSVDMQHYEDDGGVYISTNLHFYNFDKIKRDPIKVINDEILSKFNTYYSKYVGIGEL